MMVIMSMRVQKQEACRSLQASVTTNMVGMDYHVGIFIERSHAMHCMVAMIASYPAPPGFYRLQYEKREGPGRF